MRRGEVTRRTAAHTAVRVRASTARPAHERRGRRRSADPSTLSRLGARSASPVSALREPSRRSDEESSSSQQAASSSSQQQAASSSSQQQAAAASSSKQQQQAAASSSKQQQQAAARNSSSSSSMQQQLAEARSSGKQQQAAASSSKQQQAAASSSKQQQAAAASSSKQQQAATRRRTRSSTLRNVGDWRPDPSDSGRARGLGIGRQGATDIVRHREAGSHRSRPIFMRTGHTVSAITRARSHRRLQAGSLETGKRKEKGETGSHPSTRT